jgi:hypothetical protein
MTTTSTRRLTAEPVAGFCGASAEKERRPFEPTLNSPSIFLRGEVAVCQTVGNSIYVRLHSACVTQLTRRSKHIGRCFFGHCRKRRHHPKAFCVVCLAGRRHAGGRLRRIDAQMMHFKIMLNMTKPCHKQPAAPRFTLTSLTLLPNG